MPKTRPTETETAKARTIDVRVTMVDQPASQAMMTQMAWVADSGSSAAPGPPDASGYPRQPGRISAAPILSCLVQLLITGGGRGCCLSPLRGDVCPCVVVLA